MVVVLVVGRISSCTSSGCGSGVLVLIVVVVVEAVTIVVW